MSQLLNTLMNIFFNLCVLRVFSFGAETMTDKTICWKVESIVPVESICWQSIKKDGAYNCERPEKQWMAQRTDKCRQHSIFAIILLKWDWAGYVRRWKKIDRQRGLYSGDPDQIKTARTNKIGRWYAMIYLHYKLAQNKKIWNGLRHLRNKDYWQHHVLNLVEPWLDQGNWELRLSWGQF